MASDLGRGDVLFYCLLADSKNSKSLLLIVYQKMDK